MVQMCLYVCGNFDWHHVRVPTTKQHALARRCMRATAWTNAFSHNEVISSQIFGLVFSEVYSWMPILIRCWDDELSLLGGLLAFNIQCICFSESNWQMYVNVLAGVKKWNEAAHLLRSVMCHKARAPALSSLLHGAGMTSIIKWQFSNAFQIFYQTEKLYYGIADKKKPPLEWGWLLGFH